MQWDSPWCRTITILLRLLERVSSGFVRGSATAEDLKSLCSSSRRSHRHIHFYPIFTDLIVSRHSRIAVGRTTNRGRAESEILNVLDELTEAEVPFRWTEVAGRRCRGGPKRYEVWLTHRRESVRERLPARLRGHIAVAKTRLTDVVGREGVSRVRRL